MNGYLFFPGQNPITEEFHRQVHVRLGLSVSALNASVAESDFQTLSPIPHSFLFPHVMPIYKENE